MGLGSIQKAESAHLGLFRLDSVGCFVLSLTEFQDFIPFMTSLAGSCSV